jgi:radical SAM protein with 4Fe4S-binding SPASM domain
MPAWNRANIIRTAIESVLSQTCDNWELIIVDDGSDDNTAEVAGQFVSDKVRLLRQEHLGPSAARNLALKNARGRYIAYLDTDNTWHSDYLANMREAMEGGGFDCAYCMARNLVRDETTGQIVERGTVGSPFNFRQLLKGNYIDMNTFAHSAEVLKHIEWFDNDIRRLDDWDFITRVTAQFRVKFVPMVLVDYYSCIQANATSLIHDFGHNNEKVLQKNPPLPEPVTIEHDATKYTWTELPDEKYRNYWLQVRGKVINCVDYKPYVLPSMMQIEPTNLCNLRCPLCPVSQNKLRREPRHMRFEEFKKIVDDIGKHVMLLVMWDWGEPLMNPELPKMIRYATDRDIRTVTSTNAHFLTDERYVEELLCSGLSTLIVAIDSADAENYKKYRQRGSLDKALEGLRSVVKIRNRLGSPTVINFRMVVMKHNVHEIAALEKLARKMGADIFSVKTVNPACGEVGLDRELVPDDVKYRRLEYKDGTWERVRVSVDCGRVWVMSNIFTDGSVAPCCYDFDGTMVVGNVFKEPYEKIWRGEAYAALRKKIMNERSSMPRCTECMVNFKHTPQSMFHDMVDFRTSRFSQRIKRVAGRLVPKGSQRRRAAKAMRMAVCDPRLFVAKVMAKLVRKTV